MTGNLYEQAARNIAERAGEETDEDLLIYNNLKPFHFKALQNKYGFEDVRRYITLMESKRLGIKPLPGRE
jgi:hypothetical protein